MKRLVLIILAAAVAIWLFKPEMLTNIAAKTGDLLKEKVQERSKSVVVSAVTSVNEYVRQKSEAVLGEQIGLPISQKAEAEIVNDVPKKALDNIILLDYLTAKDLKLELKTDKQYYLDLRNVPEGYCLYVNQISYFVAKDKYLSLYFQSRGTYNLAFDKCDQKLQKFGEIIVE